jgi:hypothetical protein
MQGLDYLMDEVIEKGDADRAEVAITAVHRLKTAVPACMLARMGAIVGGGNDAEVDLCQRL